jgi:hypothetical protein
MRKPKWVECLITNSDVSGRVSAAGKKSGLLDYATPKWGVRALDATARLLGDDFQSPSVYGGP